MDPTRKHPDVFTAQEAIAYLHLDAVAEDPERTLETLRTSYGLRGFRLGAKSFLYHRCDLDDLVDRVFGVDRRQPLVGPLAFGVWHASGPCVYFLFSCGHLVYIGQTDDPRGRLQRHRRLGKGFDTWAYVEVERSDLDVVERVLINHYKPPLNRQCLGHVLPDREAVLRRFDPRLVAEVGHG